MIDCDECRDASRLWFSRACFRAIPLLAVLTFLVIMAPPLFGGGKLLHLASFSFGFGVPVFLDFARRFGWALHRGWRWRRGDFHK